MHQLKVVSSFFFLFYIGYQEGKVKSADASGKSNDWELVNYVHKRVIYEIYLTKFKK